MEFGSINVHIFMIQFANIELEHQM